mgnify:CR=1 FL=1
MKIFRLRMLSVASASSRNLIKDSSNKLQAPSFKLQARKDLTGPELWDIMGACLHDLNLLNSSGPSRVRRNSTSMYRATVYQRSEGFFGLVLLSAAITPSTRSIKIWTRKSPSLHAPGAAGALGKVKKRKKKATSCKRQASATIKRYKKL